MAIDTKSLSQLIAEFRKLQAKDSITPESLGYILQRKPKGRFFWFTFGICMVRIRYADQKLLCLQWKCGLGLEMALSVDARRGSAPCRWAFPGVLFIIKKCWNEILVILKKNNINHQNHSNNAKKQKNFQMTKHLHRDLSTTDQKNRPFGFQYVYYFPENQFIF